MSKLADLIEERNQIMAHVDTTHTGFLPFEARRLVELEHAITFTIEQRIETEGILAEEEGKQLQYHQNQADIHSRNLYARFNGISALEKIRVGKW